MLGVITMSQKKTNVEKKTKTDVENKTVKTKKKSNKKLDASTMIIIVGLIIIMIPFLVLGYILLSDSMKTGSPITGDRFVNDLDPAITETDLSSMNASIQNIDGVEEVECILKTATLRIYVDVDDNKTSEEVQTMTESIYEVVTDELDEATYFSQNGSKKMYDLEVHVYNLKENRDSDDFVYVIANKNSSMEKMAIQVVSEPKDPDLAKELLDELEAKNNPAPEVNEDSVTVGGESDENLEGEQGGE